MKSRTLKKSVELCLSQRQLDKLHRCERIEVALFLHQMLMSGNKHEAFEESTQGGNYAMSCMLADIRHWCDAKKLEFHELDTRGYRHYSEEIGNPDEVSRN